MFLISVLFIAFSFSIFMALKDNELISHIYKATHKLLLVYFLISALFILCAGLLYLAKGSWFIEEGPGSYIQLNILAAVASWIMVGMLIILWEARRHLTRHACFIAVFFLIAFFYLNVLREPHMISGGDFDCYWEAAKLMSENKVISQVRYMYPPLLASLIQPFIILGWAVTLGLFKIFNICGALILAILFYLVLRKYNYSEMLAAVAIFVLFLINVPISRNLIYNQVNIHMLNLILLCLLLYKKNNLLSALCLCLAVNIKVTPAVLLIPFIINREYKWLFWFGTSQIFIILLTSYLNSFGYYIYFLAHATEWSGGAFRDNSIDSFIRNTLVLINIRQFAPVVIISKILLFGVTLKLLLTSIKQKLFFDAGDEKEKVVYNGFVVLLVLMTVLTPRVWVHHFVFMLLPFIIMFKIIQERHYGLYIACYVSLFLIPTFDWYPFSYHRLLAMLVFYYLLLSSCKRKGATSNLFINVNNLTSKWLDAHN